MSSFSDLRQDLRAQTERIWLDEPAEITLVRHGIAIGGGGSNGQYFANLVHLEAFAMILGPHVMYRLLLLAEDEKIDLYALRETTLTLFERPFDHFEFFGDLGLPTLHALGERYLDEIRTIESRDAYRELTGDFVTYFNRMFRWIHGLFPWNLAAVFPKQTGADVAALVRAIEEVSR
ncbi:MAG: hypothetical protein QM626_13515 [Microbacterium sp.]|uniref:cucumopine synthase-related protein n=1 Tax=Microbacterium sp. TaxID=51671 RepID=UPI0039E447D8